MIDFSKSYTKKYDLQKNKVTGEYRILITETEVHTGSHTTNYYMGRGDQGIAYFLYKDEALQIIRDEEKEQARVDENNWELEDIGDMDE